MFGLGRRAEARAASVLRKRGYKVVARNYSCVRGEIDLICRHGDALVFVEVKARSSARHGEALAAVNPSKRRRLIAAAGHYLLAHPASGDVRFDVVAFTGEDVQVVENAFYAEE